MINTGQTHGRSFFLEQLCQKNTKVISCSCLVAGPPNAATCEQVSRTVQHGAASRSGIGPSLRKTWSESRSLKCFPKKNPCTYGNMGIFTSRKKSVHKWAKTKIQWPRIMDKPWTSDTHVNLKKSCGHGFGTCEKLHTIYESSTVFFRAEELRGWARSNDPNTQAYLDFFQRDLDGNQVGNKASITLLGNDGGYQSLSKALLLDGRRGAPLDFHDVDGSVWDQKEKWWTCRIYLDGIFLLNMMVLCEKCFSVCYVIKGAKLRWTGLEGEKNPGKGGRFERVTVPKTKIIPLKMVAFNRNLLFQGSTFRGYVSFMQGRGEGSLLVSGSALSKFSRCKVTNWQFLWLKFAQISGGELDLPRLVTLC